MTGTLWYVVIVSMIVGAGMLAFWATALATGRVPEIDSGRREIWFHVAAEVATAGLLISGAVSTLADPAGTAGSVVSCLALGMLLYSIAVSPGYYVDRREWPMVAMFAGVWALVVPAVVLRAVA